MRAAIGSRVRSRIGHVRSSNAPVPCRVAMCSRMLARLRRQGVSIDLVTIGGQIFEETRAGRLVSNDVKSVAQALCDFYDQKRCGESFTPDRDAIYQMSAKPAAIELARLLSEAGAHPAPTRSEA